MKCKNIPKAFKLLDSLSERTSSNSLLENSFGFLNSLFAIASTAKYKLDPLNNLLPNDFSNNFFTSLLSVITSILSGFNPAGFPFAYAFNLSLSSFTVEVLGS